MHNLLPDHADPRTKSCHQYLFAVQWTEKAGEIIKKSQKLKK